MNDRPVPVQPTPQQLEQLQNALLDAFDYASLKQMTRFYLELHLERITSVVGKTDLTTIVADLVTYVASRENGLNNLLDAALMANPDNTCLQALKVDFSKLIFKPIERIVSINVGIETKGR